MADPNHLIVLQFETPTDLSSVELPSDTRALVVLCVAAGTEDAKQISTLLNGTMQAKGLVKCVTHNNIVVAGFTNMLLHDLKSLPKTLQHFSTVTIKVCSAGVISASTTLTTMYKCKISNHTVTKDFVDGLVTKSVGMFLESSAPSHGATPSSQEEINQLLHSLTLAQKRPIGSVAPPTHPSQIAPKVTESVSANASMATSASSNGKYKKRYQINMQTPQEMPMQQMLPFQFAPDVQSVLVFQQQQQQHQMQQLQNGIPAGVLPLHGGLIGFPPTFHALQTMGIPMTSLPQTIPTQFSFAPMHSAMSAGMIPTLHSVGPMTISNTLTAPACAPTWKFNQVDSNLSPYAPPFQAAPAKTAKGKKARAAPATPSHDASPSMPIHCWLQQPQWRTSVKFKRIEGDYISSLKVEKDSYVIVEGDRGLDLGVVENCWLEGETSPSAAQCKISGNVMRLAEPHEIEEHNRLLEEESQCLSVVNEKVKAHNLNMKVWDVAFQFDKQKLTVFYTAPDRQDFRNLCRELYKLYHARIWFELLKEEQQAQGHPYFVKRDKKAGKKEKMQSKSPSGSSTTASPSFTEPLPTSSNACSPMSVADDSPGVSSLTPLTESVTPCAADEENVHRRMHQIAEETPTVIHAS